MLKSLLASALGAGLAAGIAAAALQIAALVPLVMEAELYETGTLAHFPGEGAAHGTEGHADDGHAHGEGDHSGGITRSALTLLSTVASYTGFALLLVAGFALAERAGLARISARTGLLWGLAGFAAFQFAPAAGLPPELPGSGAAALEDRQVWWVMTTLLTAGGIAVLAGVKGVGRFAGLVLIALPHLLGAPHPEGYAGVTPPELSALFAARALVVGAVAWAILGVVAGTLWQRDGGADPA